MICQDKLKQESPKIKIYKNILNNLNYNFSIFNLSINNKHHSDNPTNNPIKVNLSKNKMLTIKINSMIKYPNFKILCKILSPNHNLTDLKTISMIKSKKYITNYQILILISKLTKRSLKIF
jgi:hypothetical protein